MKCFIRWQDILSVQCVREDESHTALAGYILSSEGVSRAQIRAQVWRALRATVLYMRYKIDPYSTTLWKVIRSHVRLLDLFG